MESTLSSHREKGKLVRPRQNCQTLHGEREGISQSEQDVRWSKSNMLEANSIGDIEVHFNHTSAGYFFFHN